MAPGMSPPQPPQPPGAMAVPESPEVATWAPALAQAFAGLACDLALVLDARGEVLWATEGGLPPLPEVAAGWVGHAWADGIAASAQGKVRRVMAELQDQGLAARCEVELACEPPLPMAFSGLRLGAGGPYVMLGHDLRPEAALQQRFLRAQRDLELGYQEALDQMALKAADDRRTASVIDSLRPAARRLLAPSSRREAASPPSRRRRRRGAPR